MYRVQSTGKESIMTKIELGKAIGKNATAWIIDYLGLDVTTKKELIKSATAEELEAALTLYKAHVEAEKEAEEVTVEETTEEVTVEAETVTEEAPKTEKKERTPKCAHKRKNVHCVVLKQYGKRIAELWVNTAEDAKEQYIDIWTKEVFAMNGYAEVVKHAGDALPRQYRFDISAEGFAKAAAEFKAIYRTAKAEMIA